MVHQEPCTISQILINDVIQVPKKRSVGHTLETDDMHILHHPKNLSIVNTTPTLPLAVPGSGLRSRLAFFSPSLRVTNTTQDAAIGRLKCSQFNDWPTLPTRTCLQGTPITCVAQLLRVKGSTFLRSSTRRQACIRLLQLRSCDMGQQHHLCHAGHQPFGARPPAW